MPTAVCVDIAEKVKVLLDAATLSQAFTPARSYADWELELTDSDTLHVDVVAHSTEQKIEMESQGCVEFLVPVDIAVRKRFTQAQQDSNTGRVLVAQVDALVLLVQEIVESLMPNRITGDFGDAVWTGSKIVANPLLQHLRENRQFTGVVRLNFVYSKAA